MLTRIAIQWAILLGFACAHLASAAMPEKDYYAALKTMEEKIRRSQSNAVGGMALSSNTLFRLAGNSYAVGDHWEVIAWTFAPKHLRVGPPLPEAEARPASSGVFRYEVVETLPGPLAAIQLRITPIAKYGVSLPDPSVVDVLLSMTHQGSTTEKSYHLKGKDKRLAVSPSSIRSDISPLELFPLELPDLEAADVKAAQTIPELPAFTREWASRAGLESLDSIGMEVNQDDFFGRGIRAIWRPGKPWPSLLRTPTGIAILLSSDSGDAQ